MKTNKEMIKIKFRIEVTLALWGLGCGIRNNTEIEIRATIYILFLGDLMDL